MCAAPVAAGLPRPGEDALIARYFAPLALAPGAAGLLDDAAVLPADGASDQVLTTDAIAVGVHFLPDDAPGEIARKALRVNLSDLAAKGARPYGYLLTLALPDDWREDWLAAFAAGLADDQAAFGVSLLGGDTIRAAGGLTVSVTAIGTVARGAAVRRTTGRPGQRLFVTGTIGDAALGLRLRRDEALAARAGLSPAEAAFLAERYVRPRPRLDAADAIRRHAAAAMDISDGLAGDLARLCAASGTGAVIERARVPLSPAARRLVAAEPGLWPAVLAGGDDYEILAAVPPERAGDFAGEVAAAGLVACDIGVLTADSSVDVLDEAGRPLPVGKAPFQHF